MKKSICYIAVSCLFQLLFFIACLPSISIAQTIDKDYYDGRIYLKIKESAQLQLPMLESTLERHSYPYFTGILTEFGVYELDRPFPNLRSAVFENTYEIKFDQVEKVEELIRALATEAVVEYAEKIPIMRSAYTPNDGYANNNDQWYLSAIKAYQAWDIHKDGSDVVLAIVDDAVRLDHQDIQANVWVNVEEYYGSPGVDDDYNGYIDDYYGWDASNNDNNPFPPATATNSDFTHGTHCAGIAAGVTNNGTGIASISFNNAKIMACKGKPDNTTGLGLPDIWEAFAYAAHEKNSPDIISCSWGGGGYSITDQNLINYAVSNGSIVIAAAGNDNLSTPHYPAAYNNVIAVANTTPYDTKNPGSNYGSWVDIAAPGTAILSSVAGSPNSYNVFDGTSMACPLVAGLLAQMKSYKPTASNSELVNCLLASADNINGQNPGFQGMLGAGRINALAALQCLGGGSGSNCEDNAMTLTITLDEYGSETTWGIYEGNNLLAYGGPYQDGANGFVIQESLCLSDGCYDLVFFDAYSDGMCCEWGNGSYVLKDENGTSLVSGGEFGDEDVNEFCLKSGGGGSGCAAASPYSETDPIYQQVIAEDSYCCTTEWDQICQDIYDSFSGVGSAGLEMATIINIQPVSVVQGQSAAVSFNVTNTGNANFSGDISIAYYDVASNFIDAKEMSGLSLCGGCSFSNNLVFNLNINAALGEYVMVAWYRPTGGDWEQVSDNNFDNFAYFDVVGQTATTLTASPLSFDFSAMAGQSSLTITTNCTNWHISGLPNWLTATPSAGTGNAVVTLSYLANTSMQSRSVNLVISGCGLQQIIPVSQAGATGTMTASPSSFSFTATGGNETLIVTANCNWNISGLPSWLTATPSAGTGNAVVTLVSAANNSSGQQSAILTLTGCGQPQTILVTQSGCASPPAPSLQQSGTLSLCEGQFVTLSANACQGCTVHWSDNQVGFSINVGFEGTYQAYAVNGCGVSPPSAPVQVVFTEFNPNITINNQCYLAAPNGSNYKWMLAGSVVGNGQFFTASETGYYTLNMTNEEGCSGTSAPVFVVGCATAVHEIPSLASMEVYPNPANTHAYVSIELAKSTFLKMDIFSPDGSLVQPILSKELPAGKTTLPMDVASLVPGVYFYRMIGEGGVKTGRLMVQR